MKINRIVCSALMLFISISLMSCNFITQETNNYKNVSDDTNTSNFSSVEPINNETITDGINESNSSNVDTINDEHTFLIVSSESVNTSNNFKEEFKDATQYSVCCTPSIEVIDDLKNHTFLNPNGNQSLEYSYSECLYKNSLTKEYGTHYSIYDIYKNEDTEIGVLHGTDLICLYFRHEEDSTVQLTNEDAKSLADGFVVSLVGNNIFSAFDIVSVKSDTSGFFSYIINYTRLINGYKTDENMTVFIGKSGTVVAYNGYNVCKYEALKEKFDSDKIDSAKDELVNKINSLGLKDLEMKNSIITTDADGELYIRIDFSYEDDYGAQCCETALVSVS